MANKVIKYDSFKRGDTPNFAFVFSQPYVGFSWTGITADIALTLVTAPADNSGAAATRIAQSPVVDPTTNKATFNLKPTILESKALIAGAKYKVEAQLHDGPDSVVTPITGEVQIIQDYII